MTSTAAVTGKPAGRLQAFLHGAAVDFGGAAVLLVAGLVITPIALSYLNPCSYGFWMTIQQTVGMLGLLEMGASIAVTQRVANPDLAHNQEQLSRFMSASVAVQLCTAVAVVAVGLLLQSSLFAWFKIDDVVAKGSSAAYRLMVVWFAISLLIGLLPALLAARQKMAVSHGINFLVQFLTTVGVIPFLTMGLGISAFPAAQVLGGMVGLLFSLYFLRRYAPRFSVSASLVGREDIKSVLGFSFYNWIAKIAFLILTASDNIIIASTLGASFVTPYLLTSRIAGLIAPNMARFSSSALAGFAELFATQNYARLQAATIGIFKLSTRVACLGTIMVILCTQQFVSLWVGSQYFVGMTFVVTLGLLCFRDTVVKGIGIVIIASGDMRGFGLLTMVEAILKVIFAVWMIKGLKLGVTGIVIGQLLATLLVSGVYFPSKIIMLTKLSKRKLLYDGFLSVVVKSLPTLFSMCAIDLIVPKTWGWCGLGLTLFAGLIANMAVFDLPIILKAKSDPLPLRIKSVVSSYLS